MTAIDTVRAVLGCIELRSGWAGNIRRTRLLLSVCALLLAPQHIRRIASAVFRRDWWHDDDRTGLTAACCCVSQLVRMECRTFVAGTLACRPAVCAVLASTRVATLRIASAVLEARPVRFVAALDGRSIHTAACSCVYHLACVKHCALLASTVACRPTVCAVLADAFVATFLVAGAVLEARQVCFVATTLRCGCDGRDWWHNDAAAAAITLAGLVAPAISPLAAVRALLRGVADCLCRAATHSGAGLRVARAAAATASTIDDYLEADDRVARPQPQHLVDVALVAWVDCGFADRSACADEAGRIRLALCHANRRIIRHEPRACRALRHTRAQALLLRHIARARLDLRVARLHLAVGVLPNDEDCAAKADFRGTLAAT